MHIQLKNTWNTSGVVIGIAHYPNILLFLKRCCRMDSGDCRVRTDRFDSCPSYLSFLSMKYILTLTIHPCVHVFIQVINDQLLVMFKTLWFLLLETRPSSAG